MKPNRKLGVEFTWKCNWKCTTCFYRFNENLHKGEHTPIQVILDRVDEGIKNGANHAVAIGMGETSLHPQFNDFILHCKEKNITSSIITNGCTGIDRFEKFMESGLDHIHLSAHGVGETLDLISETPGAGKKQEEFKRWLKDNKVPFRTNTTLQKLNYTQLPSIAENLVSYGAKHVVLLGFLPHYHWMQENRLHQVAVHPKELRPYIEKAADIVLNAGRMFTLRYHPFCHIDSKYWKYITNARYVPFDPWEWMYGGDVNNYDSIVEVGNGLNAAVANTVPCGSCSMQLHCGGWNKTYAGGFDGAELTPVDNVPNEYKDIHTIFGGVFNMNPANSHIGYFGK